MLENLHRKTPRGWGVASAESLRQSMDKAVRRYSSLFKLPTYKKVVLLLALTCVSGGVLSTVILSPSINGLVDGLMLGISLFLTNLTLDYVVNSLVLKRDPIYDLRRTVALSLFCWVLWLFFVFLGVAVAMLFGLSWWVRLCLLGFSAVLILRLIVLGSTSSMDSNRLLSASLLQPLSCIILFMMIWARMNHPIFLIFPYLIFSIAVSLASSFFFILLLNRVGEQTLRVPSLSLFKAFLLNWIVNLNTPFEGFLERLGEERDIDVSMIRFDASKPKAVIVTPSVHPGPFKNIGSSLLPSMVKSTLEKELGCVACVPLGVLGHELDLASQLQNQKIINHIVASVNFRASETKASPFINVSNRLATACCQIFGKSAFLSFTLAPKTTEDLPQELSLFVHQEAEKRGLRLCIVVNAHNSIDGVVNTDEALNSLKTAAVACLDKAVSVRRLPFEVGAATVMPREFSLEDGMAPGGITVVVVKVGEQKTAYVVIDGNNMVSGLREKILSNLKSIGIDEGEVFTTDSHAVNALVLNRLGYNPIGEVISHEKLIGYIKEATFAAMSNLEHVKVSCRTERVLGVKVIGEKQLETLCLLTDRTLQRAKKIVIPIFAPVSLLLTFFLTLI